MKDQPAGLHEKLNEAKHAFDRAECEWKKLLRVHLRVWRENQSRPEGTPPSEEFLRVEQAYRAATATLSEAREHLRLLKASLPTPKQKPFKYGSPDDDTDETG